MKDSEGREISLSRLDMLTDKEIDQLKGDSWDDYCWKSGNQYARMVHEFCVIEQDKRIRQKEKHKIECEIATAKMDALVSRHAIEHKFWTERPPKLKKPEPLKPMSEFGPSGERLSKAQLRELRTGTE